MLDQFWLGDSVPVGLVQRSHCDTRLHLYIHTDLLRFRLHLIRQACSMHQALNHSSHNSYTRHDKGCNTCYMFCLILSSSIRTFGASLDRRVNTPCFPVLAIQSYWRVEGTVTVVANVATKSRIALQALGRPIPLVMSENKMRSSHTHRVLLLTHNNFFKSPDHSNSCETLRNKNIFFTTDHVFGSVGPGIGPSRAFKIPT